MKLVFEDNQLCRDLYGEREVHLQILEKELQVSLRARGNELELSGEEGNVAVAHAILEQLYSTLKKGFPLREEDVRRIVNSQSNGQEDVRYDQILTDVLLTTHRNRRITPRNPNQKIYVDSIRKNDLVFGIGPAGTGKTYLAMAMAVAALLNKSVERIILARPAVEAGEKLGFLPGNLQEKVNPYLRPLYDALYDMLDAERVDMLLARGTIEVAPLAFMRGRTLNHAFVILDEAQNTSSEQMKMFLTRLGHDSKAVVTGDVTQIDLPSRVRSGLVESMRVLNGVKGIAFSQFTAGDVVRHELVQRIIRAYARADEERDMARAQRRAPSPSDAEDAQEPPADGHNAPYTYDHEKEAD
jgi:phosphate starvation-inducible PhoH-like protein